MKNKNRKNKTGAVKIQKSNIPGVDLEGMLAISDYVNMSTVTVTKWIHTMDFPAWKITGRGVWVSERSKIDEWKKNYYRAFPKKFKDKRKI